MAHLELNILDLGGIIHPGLVKYPLMTKEAQTFDITPTDLAFGGEALGRLPDGRIAFVPYALPGEAVRAQMIEDKRDFARLRLLEVLSPSPQRLQPRCPHFTVCGGCQYQHLPYALQLEVKAGLLRQQLERAGGIKSPPVADAVPSPSLWNYRNHVQFHLDPQGKLGFEAPRSHQVIPVRECHLPQEAINAVWPQISLEPLPGLKQVSLRTDTDEEVLVILESSTGELPEFTVEDLTVSAVLLGPAGALSLAGSDHLDYQILDCSFRVSAASFFQVNTAQAGAMVEHLLTNLPLTPQTTLLELYSGVGLFSAFLASRVSQLVAVEASPSACQDFESNLEEFDNVELYEASVEQVLPSLSLQPDILLADPPRSGLGRKVIEGILVSKAPTLAYVSCDPATLARDSRQLIEGGFHLEKVTPFDLFPQTYHIESISLWQRN